MISSLWSNPPEKLNQKRNLSKKNQIEVKNIAGNTSCFTGQENQAQKGGGGGFK